MVKKVSQTVSQPRAAVSDEQVVALAELLADRPYGEASAAAAKAEAEAKAAEEAKAKAAAMAKPRTLSISLPGGLIEKLEDAARANKRTELGPKTVSGIIRAALEAAGFKL